MSVKQVLKSKSIHAFSAGLQKYELFLSDGATIIVWAPRGGNITRVVRASPDLFEVEKDSPDAELSYRDKYYKYSPRTTPK